ncbi:DUF2505 family protein [Corynebacterium anserum]|uniref:DUF2505 family protein n=1 Tax=Corynebacterium anserum TaxID=2684406 RepID=A0A7G7YM79_9CORY|nr:DUF2505 family protein [Corynebacterium anserum]MBC2681207.1 DUF2505 family protein [Corynebacterium anserum]QNH95599.1 DUF2505 family protein [Corynebacterium anserum]
MAKKKRFVLYTELPVEKLYEVLSSETYLITKEEMERPEQANITDTSYERRDDGVTAARVRMESLLDAPGKEPEDSSVDEPRRMVIEQTTHVQPMGSDKSGQGFSFATVMPLPGNIGAMFTDMEMTPGKNGTGTDMSVEVRVDVHVPALRIRLSQQLLGNSEETVSKGIRRAERLAQSHLQ